MIRRKRASSEADWTPFRPAPGDLERIAGEVAAIPEIQAEMVARQPDLTTGDRVAHQYQIAGGRVELRIGGDLPADLESIGLFVPGARHLGVGRLSTGLGYGHLETDPDFLGLMVAFRTAAGQRVDFLAINDPTAPTDDHRQFMKLLKASAESAGVEAPFGSGLGELDLLDLAAAQTKFSAALIRELGIRDGLKGLGHILAQTSRTLRSSTAYQTYWTGIEEVGGSVGKFVFEPVRDEKGLRDLTPGERHFSDEWRERQRRSDVEFRLHWLPFADQTATPTETPTEPWQQDPRPVGHLVFPKANPDSGEARLWATLATEMGANPGNWVHDVGDTIPHPATEFGVARKLAYRLSQAGRNALPEELYGEVFSTGRIGPALAEELERRRAVKAMAGHVSAAPPPPH
jgi:hypothetical protein